MVGLESVCNLSIGTHTSSGVGIFYSARSEHILCLVYFFYKPCLVYSYFLVYRKLNKQEMGLITISVFG